MDNIGKLLAANIKKLRKVRNWTQNDLALEAGISFRGLQDIETGRRSPRPDTLSAIAGALEVPESDLYKDPASITLNPLPPAQIDKEFITMKDLAKMEESLVERLSKASNVASPWPQYGAVPLDKEELRILRAFRGLSQKGKDVITSQLDVALKKYPLVIKDAK